jgi:hypothetical protein
VEKDLFFITYDPKKVTPAQLLEVVGKQGFEGTIRPGAEGDREPR